MRILAASLLSMGVILLWAKFFAPKPPVATAASEPAGAERSGNAGSRRRPQARRQPRQPASQQTPSTSSGGDRAADCHAARQRYRRSATIVVENDLYRVEISNRGAVVKSWQLKKYTDDAKPPHVLDVVHPGSRAADRRLAFSLVLNDRATGEKRRTTGCIRFLRRQSRCSAPADAEFSWSDGHLEVTKRFHFDHTYVVRVETSAKLDGKPITAGLAWLGGFGDLTVTNPAPVETVSTFSTRERKDHQICRTRSWTGSTSGRRASGRAEKTSPASRIAISRRRFCRRTARASGHAADALLESLAQPSR